MTAKYGKASIGCYIIGSIISFTIGFYKKNNDLPLFLLWSPWIFTLLGLWFNHIGFLIQEHPKKYWVIGFLLNGSNLLWVIISHLLSSFNL